MQFEGTITWGIMDHFQDLAEWPSKTTLSVAVAWNSVSVVMFRNIFQRSIFSRFRGMPSVSPLVFTTRLTLVSLPKLSSVPGTAGWHDRLSASLPGGSLRNPRQWQPGLPFEGLEKQGENSPQQDVERESFGILNMALWFGLVVP